MIRNRIALFGVAALLVGACGGTSEGADATPRSTLPITTTLSPAPGGGGLAGAGGLSSSGGAPRLSLVQRAMAQTVAEPPARIEGLIEIAGTAAGSGKIDVSIPFSSSFDSVTGDGQMAMDFSGMAAAMGGGDVPPELAEMFDRFEIRHVGETAYMQFAMFTMMFGADTPWISMPAEEGRGFAQDFSAGVNPYDATSFLDALSGTGGEVTVVGAEQLRGVDTTRYHVNFDLEALAALDPAAFTELQSSGVGIGELPMDLWIDGSNRIHRYLMEIDGPEIGDLAPGESFDHMRVQFDFSDYGGRVTVEPPPADQVTDMSELEDLFGGLVEFDV